MGDVVLYFPNGKSLRFSHEDFQKLGRDRGFYGWEIYFSQRWRTMTGDIQFGVSHSSQIEEEEERFGGHNAHIHDSFGATQIFASTKNKTEGRQEATYPNGTVVAIHEVGYGSIEGTYREVTESHQLSAPNHSTEIQLTKRGRFGGLLDRFRRK